MAQREEGDLCDGSVDMGTCRVLASCRPAISLSPRARVVERRIPARAPARAATARVVVRDDHRGTTNPAASQAETRQESLARAVGLGLVVPLDRCEELKGLVPGDVSLMGVPDHRAALVVGPGRPPATAEHAVENLDTAAVDYSTSVGGILENPSDAVSVGRHPMNHAAALGAILSAHHWDREPVLEQEADDR